MTNPHSSSISSAELIRVDEMIRFVLETEPSTDTYANVFLSSFTRTSASVMRSFRNFSSAIIFLHAPLYTTPVIFRKITALPYRYHSLYTFINGPWNDIACFDHPFQQDVLHMLDDAGIFRIFCQVLTFLRILFQVIQFI